MVLAKICYGQISEMIPITFGKKIRYTDIVTSKIP